VIASIIWINGPFSVGKSTVAKLLVERLGETFLFDPETVGALLRDHCVPPSLQPSDYQDLPLWRELTREVLIYLGKNYAGTVVVPMTLARDDYFAEIIEPLREHTRLDHFTLLASRETILDRENERPDDTGGWARMKIDQVLPALQAPTFGVHVDAEQRGPEAVADDIIERLR
jgi:chloramphenicol 3-O-phosphotransferase